MPFNLREDDKGIFPDRMIAALCRTGAIIPQSDFDDGQIQPASIDLRLGEIAYRVRASFLPGPHATVAERIDQLKLHEIPLGDGAVLETGCVYIVPVIESLALPPDIAAAANPKSSTGRLDVFTRVIADQTPRLRPHRSRLSRAALCRDQPAHLPGPGARGVAADAGQVPSWPRGAGRRCARRPQCAGSSR